jgi:ATP-dependent phosphofructokinase / diphosphate-dependent phosphofructokinase
MTARRISIGTGGGDAPGLNAVIRAVTLGALERGWECVGIRDGYNGLLKPEKYGGKGVVPLTRAAVRGITHLGGTILGTTNRGDPLSYPVAGPDGEIQMVDRTGELIAAFASYGIDTHVAVGGDGSMRIAHALSEKGLRVVGVPKTIDNDLAGTNVTFGFNSASSFATQAVDRLHSTAEAHGRIMVVEMMGRYAGWIALYAGVAGTADVILIPEIPYDITRVAAKVNERNKRGYGFSIVVVAEGARPIGGELTVLAHEAGRAERLGGVGDKVAAELETITGQEARVIVLGHLQRGGSPTTYDRLLALRFGAAAVRAIEAGKSDIMVSLDPPDVRYVPLAEATERIRTVPLDSDILLTARDLGISFGD